MLNKYKHLALKEGTHQLEEKNKQLDLQLYQFQKENEQVQLLLQVQKELISIGEEYNEKYNNEIIHSQQLQEENEEMKFILNEKEKEI